MSLTLFDEHDLLVGEYSQYVSLSEKVVSAVVSYMGEKDISVELTLVTEDEIKEVNSSARGVDRVTDVLSFPSIERAVCPIDRKAFAYNVDPETGELMLGEILLCVKRCSEQAEEYGHGMKREFAYLLTHAMLHLFGFDHMKDDEKAVMRQKEEEILTILDIKR